MSPVITNSIDATPEYTKNDMRVRLQELAAASLRKKLLLGEATMSAEGKIEFHNQPKLKLPNSPLSKKG